MAPLLDATFVVACARGRRPSKRGRQARSLSSRSNARSGGSALLQNHPVLKKRSSRQALQGVAAFVHRAALFCLTALCEEHAGSTMMGNLIITYWHGGCPLLPALRRCRARVSPDVVLVKHVALPCCAVSSFHICALPVLFNGARGRSCRQGPGVGNDDAFCLVLLGAAGSVSVCRRSAWRWRQFSV